MYNSQFAYVTCTHAHTHTQTHTHTHVACTNYIYITPHISLNLFHRLYRFTEYIHLILDKTIFFGSLHLNQCQKVVTYAAYLHQGSFDLQVPQTLISPRQQLLLYLRELPIHCLSPTSSIGTRPESKGLALLHQHVVYCYITHKHLLMDLSTLSTWWAVFDQRFLVEVLGERFWMRGF